MKRSHFPLMMPFVSTVAPWRRRCISAVSMSTSRSKNIIQLIDAGIKVGMPTMAVTGVGKDMVRDQRYFSLATRIAAEMGAQIIKTYYVDKGFERIAAGCPVPIVIAGGKKLPEREALEMCWQAIDQWRIRCRYGT